MSLFEAEHSSLYGQASSVEYKRIPRPSPFHSSTLRYLTNATRNVAVGFDLERKIEAVLSDCLEQYGRGCLGKIETEVQRASSRKISQSYNFPSQIAIYMIALISMRRFRLAARMAAAEIHINLL